MKLTLIQRLLAHYSFLALTLSGLIWLTIYFYLDFDSDWYFLGSLSMKIHGFAAFIFLVMFGMVASTHISFNWQVKKNRRISGIILVAIFVILILSGYLLYYCGGDNFRKYTSYFHWSIGAGSSILYIFHALKKAKKAEEKFSTRLAGFFARFRFQPNRK